MISLLAGRNGYCTACHADMYDQNLPCQINLDAASRQGTLAQLDSRNPVMYIDLPEGRLKLFGTLMFPSNRYLVLKFGAKDIICEDILESMVRSPPVLWPSNWSPACACMASSSHRHLHAWQASCLSSPAWQAHVHHHPMCCSLMQCSIAQALCHFGDLESCSVGKNAAIKGGMGNNRWCSLRPGGSARRRTTPTRPGCLCRRASSTPA